VKYSGLLRSYPEQQARKTFVSSFTRPAEDHGDDEVGCHKAFTIRTLVSNSSVDRQCPKQCQQNQNEGGNYSFCTAVCISFRAAIYRSLEFFISTKLVE
jgi:hypothetical protein